MTLPKVLKLGHLQNSASFIIFSSISTVVNIGVAYLSIAAKLFEKPKIEKQYEKTSHFVRFPLVKSVFE